MKPGGCFQMVCLPLDLEGLEQMRERSASRAKLTGRGQTESVSESFHCLLRSIRESRHFSIPQPPSPTALRTDAGGRSATQKDDDRGTTTGNYDRRTTL